MAGRYTLDGRLTKDSIEMFDQAQAMSLALSAGYTPWKVEARIDDNDGDEDDRKITYKITNLITQETYDSTEEPHGRRCRDRDGTWFEDERAEADRTHDVIDKFSNQVVV